MKRPLIPTFSLNEHISVAPKPKNKIHYKMDLGSAEDIAIYKKRMALQSERPYISNQKVGHILDRERTV